MSITIDIPNHEIETLKQMTHRDNDADAVIVATREFMRLARLRELKGASGKVEFESNWRALEAIEQGELLSPCNE